MECLRCDRYAVVVFRIYYGHGNRVEAPVCVAHRPAYEEEIVKVASECGVEIQELKPRIDLRKFCGFVDPLGPCDERAVHRSVMLSYGNAEAKGATLCRFHETDAMDEFDGDVLISRLSFFMGVRESKTRAMTTGFPRELL